MKKKIMWSVAVVLLILAIALVYCTFFNNKPAEMPVYDEKIEIEGDTYQLVFYDDFEGKKLNKNYWSICPEQKRQDMGGRWDDSMISLDGNGNLVITADLKKNVPISGGIRTKGKYEQARGYFEARCRLQSAPGFWGGLWLMCDEQHKVGNGATDGAEIDVMESFDTDGVINHAIHWDGYGKNHQSIAYKADAPQCYDGKFHTFAVLWTDKEYIWYIDGKESYRLSEGDEDYPGSNEAPTYIKLTAEFGSAAGVFNPSTLPDNILIDYVKAYQKVN